MSRSVRLLIPAVAAAALAVSAPVAGAASVTTPNACTTDGTQYGDLPLQIEATGTQNGRNLEVGPAQPSVVVPSWLPAKLEPYVGALGAVSGAGTKSVKVDAWMAVAATGGTDAPRVMTTTGAVKITLTGNIFSGFKIGAISLTMQPTASSSWHVADAGGPLSLSQAPAGSLPAIPAGAKGAMVTPKGSLFIRGDYNGLFTLLIDCQPGGTGGDGSTLSPSFIPGSPTTILSSTFAALQTQVPVTQVPVVGTDTPALPTPAAPAAPSKTAPAATAPPKSTVPAGPLAISSTSLKFGSAAVLVSVSCPAGGPDCTGSAAITSAAKLKIGKGAAKARKLAAGTYTVPAGTTAPVKLKLSADGKKLRKTALVAKVTLTPQSGAAIAKRLKANG